MIYGFTGTKNGMTTAQLSTLYDLLKHCTKLHHGGCYGADAEAHAISLHLGIEIRVHPSTLVSTYFPCQHHYPPFPPLKRNRHIVQSSSLLIAAPRTNYEVLRSGTWAAVRCARRMGRAVTIIQLDGTCC